MGYYSNYTLTAHDINTREQIVGDGFVALAKSIKYFPEAANRKDDGHVFDDITDGQATAHSKWYDREKCLEEASLANPGVVFELHISGEEQGDIGMLVAHDGAVNGWVAPEVFPPNWWDLL